MPTKAINFFLLDVKFSLKNRKILKEWLENIALGYKYRIIELNYIFCSDSHLLKINKQFLGHDTLTDIISFDYSVKNGEIKGEIYISVERIKENSKLYNATFSEELNRVIVHGLLHLLGYHDDSEVNKQEMREKEDYYLSLL
jgi:rRNA maturation RNase YbeY